jgi:hypothetical protein
MLAVFVIAFALAVLAPAALAATGYQRAIELERQGRIAEAASALGDAELAGAQARHAADIRAAAAALAAATLYDDAGEEGAAERALSRTLGQLDASRDPYLVLALEQRLGDVRNEGMVADVGHTAESASATVGKWLGLALLVLAVPLLLWLTIRWLLGRLSPRPGVSIAVDDLAVEPAVRAEASQVLGHQLASALTSGRATGPGTSATELDVSNDLDGGMALNARVEARRSTRWTRLSVKEPLLPSDPSRSPCAS